MGLENSCGAPVKIEKVERPASRSLSQHPDIRHALMRGIVKGWHSAYEESGSDDANWLLRSEGNSMIQKAQKEPFVSSNFRALGPFGGGIRRRADDFEREEESLQEPEIRNREFRTGCPPAVSQSSPKRSCCPVFPGKFNAVQDTVHEITLLHPFPRICRPTPYV